MPILMLATFEVQFWPKRYHVLFLSFLGGLSLHLWIPGLFEYFSENELPQKIKVFSMKE